MILYINGCPYTARCEGVDHTKRWDNVSIWRDGLCHQRVTLPRGWLADDSAHAPLRMSGNIYSKDAPR
jgi:hypothetical protein